MQTLNARSEVGVYVVALQFLSLLSSRRRLTTLVSGWYELIHPKMWPQSSFEMRLTVVTCSVATFAVFVTTAFAEHVLRSVRLVLIRIYQQP
jgi:hypothetical protein